MSTTKPHSNQVVIEHLANELGVSDKVIFLGFLPYKNYIEELGKADIFIHPSIVASDGDSEGGAPTVLLEAQASGLPILSTYHADIPNVVLPGDSAILCPERNDEILAGNILYLLNKQELWSKMGLAGRRFIEAYHDIDNEVKILEEKYLKLLEE